MESSRRDETIYFIRHLTFFILTGFSFLAINIQTTVVDIPHLTEANNGYPKIVILFAAFKEALGTIGPVQFIAAIAIIWLYYQTILSKNSKFYISAFITGFIFSACLLIGISFSKYEDFTFITQSKYQIIIALTLLIGYWGIFYSGISLIIIWLDTLNLPEQDLSKIASWIDSHFFIISIVIILLCWIPYCIAYFPGSLTYDGQNQLDQFYGILTLGYHHPVTSTIIMGSIVRLGDFLVSKNFGIALYMVFQSVICAIIFASICNYIRQKKMPLSFSIVCILFYAIIPTWGAYAQSVIKDTLYYGIFSWFTLEYIKCFLGDNKKYEFIKLAVSAILVCLLRSEGIYIAFVSILLFLLIAKKNRKKIGIVLLSVFIAGTGINGVLISSLGVQTDDVKESMSIPFMQIARYVRDYGDDLDNEGIEIIDAILDYENLAENYVAELADTVKDTYRRKATNEDWKAFWKLWAEKFIEHPVVYIEATINQMYGYFDPFYFYTKSVPYNLFIKGPITSNEDEPIYASYVFPYGLRYIAEQYIYAWQKIPLLSLLVNCGAYTWAGILLFTLILRKKDWRSAMIYIIPILTILICCLSPVNGYLRYMLPVMASMPLYIYIALRLYLFPSFKEESGNKYDKPYTK